MLNRVFSDKLAVLLIGAMMTLAIIPALYATNNNADLGQINGTAQNILTILIAALCGWLLFSWIRGFYGDKIALLTLFFYVFSPAVLAYSLSGESAIAADFILFLAVIIFYKFLDAEDNKSVIFFIAVLSVILFIKNSFVFSIFLLAAFGLIGLIFIFLKHLAHLQNMPSIKEKAIHLSKKEGLMGLKIFLMFAAAFLISSAPSIYLQSRPILYFDYFDFSQSISLPTIYILKEQFAFHILTLLVLIITARSLAKGHKKNLAAVIEWANENFFVFMSVFFTGIYWLAAVFRPYEIAIQSILPVLPFVYFLVARGLVKWIHEYTYADPQNYREWLYSLYEKFIKSIPKYLFLLAMLLWIFLEAVIASPYYLSYHNLLFYILK